MVNELNASILFTYPNADEGFKEYIKLMKQKLSKKIIITPNLGIEKYHYILNKSDILIGNSSSGIIESCSFNVRCINIGERQKNRFSPKNVLHSSFNLNQIRKT